MRPSNWPSSIRFVIALIWLALVTAFYFVVHKPASNEQLTALARWLPGLVLSGLVAIVAAGVGYRFVRGWGEVHQRATLSLGLGLGLYSGATLLLGLLGVLNVLAGWALLIIGVLLGWKYWRLWWADLRELIHGIQPISVFPRLAAAYSLTVLIVALLRALAPATGWDSLAYHLVGPELYLANGRITHPIDLPYLGFPQFGEMLFLYLSMLGSQVPAVVHWIFAVMTALLVAGEARRLWNNDVAWLAAAIFLSAETVVLEAGWPYIDLMLAFNALAAWTCLQVWQIDRARRSLLLAAACTGFMLATKYSAAPLLIGLGLIVLWRAGVARVRSFLLFAVSAAVVALPWYLKSWLLLGNPVYPFVFGGKYWDEVRSAIFGQMGTGLAFTLPWRLLTAPWDATIWGVEGKVGYAATIGPLFLLLTPMALLGWKRYASGQRRTVPDALVIIALAYAAWLIGLAGSVSLLQSRLLVPLFPLLALIAANAFEVLDQWSRPSLSLKRIGMVLVSIVWVTTGVKIVLDVAESDTLPVLAGGITTEEYLARQLGWHYAALQALKDDAPGGPVLFLWEPRALYCTVECWPDAMIDRWEHARRTIGSPDQIAQQWRSDGVRYVLLWRTGYEAMSQLDFRRLTDDDRAALQTFVAQELELVRDYGGNYQLYRWRE